MHCPDCGTFFPENQAFCLSCGQVLSDGSNQARLGPYELMARIGQGGMGMVYRANDKNLGREVAIKVLHRHMLNDDKQIQRFRREARMHSQLMHANIVTLLDVYDEDETLALVMELISGCTLKEFLKKRGIPSWGEIVYISNAILSALDVAHTQGVVHRDLKLSNVFLGDDGSIKLMDFGLAKTTQPNEDITDSGATVGTYYYMAPEQILGSDIDARTDLYAFGVILYRMCSGELPFMSTGGGEFEIMEKQVRQTPVRPEKLNKKTPKDLDALVMELINKVPDKRPANCQLVMQRLAKIAKPTAPQLKGMNFSDLHLELQANKKPNKPDSEEDSTTSKSVDDEIPQHSFLWAFRNASPEAPEEPPLDLRSPPPIDREHLQRLKAGIQSIPPLPDNWTRIERILNDPESAPSDLAHEIEHDPVLSAHVLSLANSAAFAMPGQKVENVAIGIARLGMDNIHDFLMQKLLPKFGGMHPDDGIISMRDEMRIVACHSMAVALVFRQLSDYGQIVEHKSASLFGIMHDIGKLVILHLEDGETLQQLRISIAGGTPSLKAEWDTLGYTHIDAGMMLALHWRLPRLVHRFIYFHHHPAWHTPDVWPIDMQPAIMLNHMAHITLQSYDDIEGLEGGGIWSPDLRSHLPNTESILRQPLKLPLKDVSHYQQIHQNMEKLASTFSILYPHASEEDA